MCEELGKPWPLPVWKSVRVEYHYDEVTGRRLGIILSLTDQKDSRSVFILKAERVDCRLWDEVGDQDPSQK